MTGRTASEAAVAAADEPRVFAEPWQAEAFALMVALHERGLFSSSEWSRSLAGEVGRADASSDGSDYYEHWLGALEGLLASKGVVARSEVDRLAAAWARAAHATPHGRPILLENDPERMATACESESKMRLD